MKRNKYLELKRNAEKLVLPPQEVKNVLIIDALTSR